MPGATDADAVRHENLRPVRNSRATSLHCPKGKSCNANAINVIINSNYINNVQRSSDSGDEFDAIGDATTGVVRVDTRHLVLALLVFSPVSDSGIYFDM